MSEQGFSYPGDPALEREMTVKYMEFLLGDELAEILKPSDEALSGELKEMVCQFADGALQGFIEDLQRVQVAAKEGKITQTGMTLAEIGGNITKRAGALAALSASDITRGPEGEMLSILSVMADVAAAEAVRVKREEISREYEERGGKSMEELIAQMPDVPDSRK